MASRILVLGQGAWGSTLARRFRLQGHQLTGWSRSSGHDPVPLLAGVDLVLVTVAMAGVPELARRLAHHWPEGLPLLSGTKGIDPGQLCSASGLWAKALGHAPLLVLSGPNLAAELDKDLPAASVLACADRDLAVHWQQQLSSDVLRLYTNQDVVGTEVAGALKNVMAVAAGVCDGMGLGANARASLLCRGLREMGIVLAGLGGCPATLYGLAGLGDLLATATSPLSRNYRFGLLLAEGCGSGEAQRRIGATVEGPGTALAVQRLARERSWELPITAQVVELLEGRSSPAVSLRELMARDLTEERV